MKKLTLTLTAWIVLSSGAFAGSETYTKESKTAITPSCPQWFADNEFNVSLWGTYASSFRDWQEDTYLLTDHAWGGGVDAKYFFHRYFGVGIQGYLIFPNSKETLNDGTNLVIIGDDRRTVGSVLGTFTLRLPISCTRFAPYAWVGGGGIFGGGEGRETLFLAGPAGTVAVDHRFPESNSRIVGQIGAGFEVRITPHLGITNDFSWNVISGPDNNFGMIRSGLNIAF